MAIFSGIQASLLYQNQLVRRQKQKYKAWLQIEDVGNNGRAEFTKWSLLITNK